MPQDIAALMQAALPAPIDAPVRVALVLICGTFAGHSFVMANKIDAPVWLARWALIASVPLCVMAAVAALAGQTVGGLVLALAGMGALCVAYLRIWAGGAWASQKLREEWAERERQFHLTSGHLAPMYLAAVGTPGKLGPYAPAPGAPGDSDPYHRPTDHHAADAAALAEVDRLYSDQPTQPAELATPPHTPKGTP